MDEALYHLHYEQEESHWWFAARSAIVRRAIERYGNLKPGDTILDIGCGTGAILKEMSATYNAVGIDMSPLAIEYSKRRGLKNVFQMTVEEFPRDKFNVKGITLLDVIEHIDDDLAVLKAAREIVGTEGRIIITVPAYMWLWSSHDVANHHKRRYTAKRLRKVLDDAGLEPVKMTYYNTLLFPLAAVKKLLSRSKSADVASRAVDQPSAFVNTIFKAVFSLERFIVPFINLPYGVSLLTVARAK
ncbi:MAG: class I SAM-dependent methyltransferase [Bacteroidetes bacterium]|nr:class I SAM-dependent methyltransferase [Bacteroidota bacterium]